MSCTTDQENNPLLMGHRKPGLRLQILYIERPLHTRRADGNVASAAATLRRCVPNALARGRPVGVLFCGVK
jgi:hypothetical protein